jgi:hypothetical protein
MEWPIIYNLVNTAFQKKQPLSLYEARLCNTNASVVGNIPCAFFLDIDDEVAKEEDHCEEVYCGVS